MHIVGGFSSKKIWQPDSPSASSTETYEARHSYGGVAVRSGAQSV